jgi:ubiquinone/menaquinone biosynthesis C-methylase UbiE
MSRTGFIFQYSSLLLAPLSMGMLVFAQSPAPSHITPQKLAPFVTSPQPIVERMLELVNLKSGETLYDLGCGDGRILVTAAQRYGAKAVGVELSDALVKKAQSDVDRQGLQNKIRIIQGDMMSIDVSNAQVVSLYLMTEANDQLRPKLERELKPGARVVSLDFKVRGWKPSKVDKFEASHRPYTIYVYSMPQLP